MQSELAALLAVQAKDNEILSDKRKITHHQDRCALVQKQLDQATVRNQRLHEELEKKSVEGRRLSDEVDHLSDHIREQERKLSEDIVSFKELGAIKESIEHGHQHIDELEETALALLDEIEVESEEVKQKDTKFAEKKSQLEAEIAQINGEIDGLQSAVSQLQAERAALWDQLSEHLKTTYSQICRNVSDPLAPVTGQNCGGCHLQLSSQLIQEIRSGTSLARCEHCSRILYIP